MNVASAISAAPQAPALMTARNGKSVDEVAGTGTPSSAEQDRSLFQRFPVIAFSYEADASRLVMLYRDPDTGKTIEQIPSEAALKQYKEQQTKDRRKELGELRLLIGAGDGADTGRFGSTTGAPSGVGSGRFADGTDVPDAARVPAGVAGSSGSGAAGKSGVNLLV
jgi:hypothetical protein